MALLPKTKSALNKLGALGHTWQTQLSSLTEVPMARSLCSVLFSVLLLEVWMQKTEL